MLAFSCTHSRLSWLSRLSPSKYRSRIGIVVYVCDRDVRESNSRFPGPLVLFQPIRVYFRYDSCYTRHVCAENKCPGTVMKAMNFAPDHFSRERVTFSRFLTNLSVSFSSRDIRVSINISIYRYQGAPSCKNKWLRRCEIHTSEEIFF